MTKDISTLVQDIYSELEEQGGWDAAITRYFTESLEKMAQERLEEKQEPRTNLGLSMLGTPCERKLWYQINEPHKAEPFDGETIGNFLYGDIMEAFVLSLAKAAGHEVEGEQDELWVHGVKGHRDCIIDGMVVDVKTCSSRAFSKFEEGKVPLDDPFGYISQLSSYLYASREDERVKYKKHAAFLAVRKERFKLVLDTYELSDELLNKKKEVERAKQVVQGTKPSERIPPVGMGKNASNNNQQLSVMCRYCSFKRDCWPEARKFIYGANGSSPTPVYLVHVDKLPRVPEEPW